MHKYYREGVVEEVQRRYRNECCNCGETEHLDIHHIVPLSCGGTDKIENLVLVCQRCHQGLHHGHHIDRYKSYKNCGGRKRIARNDVLFMDYIHAKISVPDAAKKMGCSNKHGIKQTFNFREFMKDNGIADVMRYSGGHKNYQKSKIIYSDGRIEFWRNGEKANE